jgi:hypothetical protein
MMQVRCQHCRWMFTLSRDGIGLALAEAQAKNEQYHAITCPQCRHVIKLQISDMRRRLPADYVLPEWSPPATEPAPAEPAAEKPPEENTASKTEPAKPKRAPRLTPDKSRGKMKPKAQK